MFTAFAGASLLAMATAEWARASLVSASVPASATGGAPGSIAFSGSIDAASTWYSTLMRSRASSAIDSSSAATAATGWPMNTARSMARTAGARVGAFFLGGGVSLGGEHRAHAGQRLGRAHVDRDDLRVRVRAAQQLGVKEALGLDVGHVLHAAGDLLGAVGPRDRDAHSIHVAGGLHRAHRALPCEASVPAASLIAVTILV